MKRLSFVLAAIGLSAASGALAAFPAATDPTEISVPQLPGGFEVGVSGYYLQPSDSSGDLNYATIANAISSTAVNSNSSNTFNAANGQVKNVAPGYDWGWGASVGYVFPNTGNDIKLSYLNLDSKDTSNIQAQPGFNTNLSGTTIAASGVNPVVPGINPWTPFTEGSAQAKYDLNQVDLTAGQYINVGCRLSLHPFAGVRYASLDRTLNSNYSSGNNTLVTPAGALNQSSSATVNEESDFDGIGPIMGMDASYYVGAGFGLVAHVDAALLIGSIDSKTNINTYDEVAFTPTVLEQAQFASSASDTNLVSAKSNNTSRVVPVLDGKAGVNYTFLFNNAANSNLSLEVGYQASSYDNAVDRLQVGGSNVESSSVGFNGPYASLTLHV